MSQSFRTQNHCELIETNEVSLGLEITFIVLTQPNDAVQVIY